MSRGTLAVDRLLTALAGVVLTALGVIAVLWYAGRLGSAPTRVDLGGIRGLSRQQWWPWALGAAGVILALLGLRWLLSHLPRRGVASLFLPGSGPEGRLLVATGPVLDAAATALAGTPGVRSARGRIVRDRGEIVARLDATIARGADLRVVVAAADAVTGDLQSALERDDLTARVQLRTAGRNKPMPRVY